MTVGGPAFVGVDNGQVDCCFRGVFFGPDRAGYLLASEQVVLNAREDTAPITAIDSFVNDTAGFDINSAAFDNFVIYVAE